MSDLWGRRLKTAGLFTLAVLAAVSGLSTLIFGLAQEGTARLAFAGIGIVVLAPTIYLLGIVSVDVVVRFRDYQKLLDAVGQARDSLQAAQEDLADVPDKLAKERLRGQLETLGAVTANSCPIIPTLTNARIEDGRLTFYADVQEGQVPAVGSRYLLQSALGTRRGILAVAKAKDESSVILEVREQEEAEGRFWDAAMDRAHVHEALPENVTLVPDPLLRELEKKVE
ncbi:hypothetical protein [Pseudarthrobacter sp. BIM B-2242]|uniref:hypothetical protein n=1 Tax=Pseudarthrobacter sp. BIM B-2242 TaxID=2772401 RepID=UPI00168B4CE5|nr:hypothetical protein [Pseudarthrobacter sp. BIM B-2242]QOD04382.1 hypothetical protein IDT60_04790 [Pseudarthrobacter sp. BIM B-2242]